MPLAGGLGEQIDRRRCTEHLDEVGAEAPADGEPEPVAVEGNGPGDVVDVDVDEQAGHARAMTTRRLRLPLFSIFSTTTGPISPVARTCVPPQSSTEY